MSIQQPTGLIHSGDQAVALQGVSIDIEARGASALVRMRQRYLNTEDQAIDASYLFPLEEGSALVGFKVHTGGKSLVGQLLERDEAFEQYDDALEAGHGAYLLDQERPNAFTAQVGKIKSGQEATIEISYVSSLSFEGDKVRLMIPTVVAPRYVPRESGALGESDQERWASPRHAEVPYGLTLNALIEGAPLSCEVSSPSHPISVMMTERSIKVSLACELEELNRDFILNYSALPSLSDGVAHLERSEGGEAFIALTFKAPAASDQSEQRDRFASAELHCVLDCSGSMYGEPIQQAKRALGLLFRSLEEGQLFNLWCFGCDFKTMWPSARPFNQENLTQALAYLKRVDADLGGTEIMQPLQELFKRLRERERFANVVLLTDGQVSNEAEVISSCQKNQGLVRVMSFGLGDGVSEHLVRGCARVSNGVAEFIAQGERIEPKVLRVAKRLSQPLLQLKSLKLGERELSLVRPYALFEGDLITAYAHLDAAPEHLPESVELMAGAQRCTLPLSEVGAIKSDELAERAPLQTLWARERLNQLEDEPSELLAHALKYGLCSSKTSFVAVEEREESELELGDAPLRKIPLMSPRDHQMSRSVMPHAAPMSPIVGAFASAFASPVGSGFAPPRASAMPASFGGAPPSAPAPSAPAAPRSPRASSAVYNAPLYMDEPALGEQSELELLLSLLELQQASGGFIWGEALGESLKRAATGAIDLSELRVATPGLLTAIALKIFEALFSAERALWEMGAIKAERFMERGEALSDAEQAWLEAQL